MMVAIVTNSRTDKRVDDPSTERHVSHPALSGAGDVKGSATQRQALRVADIRRRGRAAIAAEAALAVACNRVDRWPSLPVALHGSMPRQCKDSRWHR